MNALRILFYTAKIYTIHILWKTFSMVKDPPASMHVLVCPICNGGN